MKRRQIKFGKKLMKKIFIIASLLFLFSCESTKPFDFSSPSTLAGYGSPTIIFESGSGDNRSVWREVFLSLAQETSVFAYDRYGVNRNSRKNNFYIPEPDGIRTAEETINYLRDLLRESDAPRPYILVGHSLGGEYVLTYAKLYPEEVAGIVLVDSRPPTFEDACNASAAAKIYQCARSMEQIAMMPEHIAAEIRALRATEAGIPSPEELIDIPITLLYATKPPAPEYPQELHNIWKEEQLRYAGGAENVKVVAAVGARHYIQRDQPELVIKEIRKLLYNMQK